MTYMMESKPGREINGWDSDEPGTGCTTVRQHTRHLPPWGSWYIMIRNRDGTVSDNDLPRSWIIG